MEIDQLLELPWAKSYLHVLLKERGLDAIVDDPSFSFSEHNDDFLRRHWATVSGFTLLDPFRMGILLDLLTEVAPLPGNIVEFGCFRGGTAFMLGLWLKEQGLEKSIHLFDSFEGLPEIDGTQDKGYRRGEFKSNYDELSANVERFGLQHMIVTHKGWFNETIGSYLASDPKIAMLHIDCDLYASTMDCYPALKDRVAEGGAVIFDDFNDGAGGEKRAFFEVNDRTRELVVGPAPQVFYRERQIAEPAIGKSNGQVSYDFERLRGNASYLRWLKTVAGLDFEQILHDHAG